MSYIKFTIEESWAVTLPEEDLDTDQIIPARFLKTTTRDGFGENLFYDRRFDTNGEEIKEFVLNRAKGDETFWLPVEISGADRAGSMPPGHWLIGVSA